MLQVTVHPLRELRQVTNTALFLKQANGGKDLKHDEYAASDRYNGQVNAKSKRRVYFHEVNEGTLYTDGEIHSDYEPFDIDTAVETIQAYASNYRPTPSRGDTNVRVPMPKDIWLSLDDKTKAIWDSIDDKFKNIILGYTPSTSPTSSFTPHRGRPPNTSSINLLSNPGRRFYMNFLSHSATNLKKFKKKPQLMMPHYQLTFYPIPPADLLINAAKGVLLPSFHLGISVGLCPRTLSVLYTLHV
jgi:hypothetical protein